MPQIREHNFQDLGIELPLNLQGDLRILCEVKGLPVVFLFDENHDNLNNCIDKNFENAKELIQKGNITIVGVESLPGGKKWDIDSEDYSEVDYNKFERLFVDKWKSECTKFADLLSIDYSSNIYGIENIEMSDKIQMDLMPGNQYFGRDVSTHHLNSERSKYFIKRLFEHYVDNNLNGNLILNCGSNHNNDIEKLIKSGEIDVIANYRANYIRINTFIS